MRKLLYKCNSRKRVNFTKFSKIYILIWYIIPFMELDEKDMKILHLLKEDARLTVAKIAKKINMPITTVHNRIKKFRQEDIIKNYTINLNYHKLGKHVYAYVLVSAAYSENKRRDQEMIMKDIQKLPYVEEVCTVTGANDIIVRVRCTDIEELNEFLIRQLRPVEGVEKTQTLIVLDSV